MMSGKENDDPRPEWSSVAMKSSAVKTYWAQWDQIETHEGVLFRRWETDDGRMVRRQILLPEKLRKEVVMEMHGNPLGGHLGVRKTLAKVKARFYWCGMTADIRSFIRTCSLCRRRKSPPKKHANADGLSRMRCKQCGRGEEANTETVNGMSSSLDREETECSIRSIASQPTMNKTAIREAQLSDDTIQWIVQAKENNDPRPEWKEIAHKSAAAKTYWAKWNQLEVADGVLCRRWESDDGKTVRKQIIMPEKLRKDAMRDVHGGPLGAHLGLRKTLAKMKLRFYWCGMAADARSFIRTCDLCARRKSPPRQRRAPLQQSRVGAPMERIALDLMGPLPKTESGNRWILVVGDYHTKWVEAYALPDARAETVARKLVEEFISRFGVPNEIHSDQGSNFKSHLFAEVCVLLGVTKTRTTPYNPKSDGMIERFNRTLINMVAILLGDDTTQKTWDEHLAVATSAYRSSPHESTGETPNMLMLGRETKLPVDLTTQTIEEEEMDEDYAQKLRSKIQKAHQRAQACIGKAAVHQKRNYDRKASSHGLREGIFVWLHDPSKRKGISPKLQLRWKGPFLIVTQLSDVVFRIQASPRSKPVVVHADRLKPYEGEELNKWTWEPPQIVEDVTHTQELHKKKINDMKETNQDAESDSELSQEDEVAGQNDSSMVTQPQAGSDHELDNPSQVPHSSDKNEIVQIKNYQNVLGADQST